MATLAKLIQNLRPYVLSVAVAPRGLDIPVNSVVVYDPVDPAELGPGDILLGVGIPASAAAISVIEQAAAAGAAAIVIKMRLPTVRQLTAAAATAGIGLLAAPPGATWTQILTLIRTVLAASEVDLAADHHGSLPPTDLFGVANAIASLLDVPITIEDPQSRVIAFSGGQENTDQPRIDTILGRQVPERILRRLRAEGVFERLKRSSEPIYFAPGEAADIGREAVAIRAGDEILGWIWAAVKEPLNSDRRRALTEAANLVAVHLARSRLDADVERRVQSELVASLLEGRGPAQEAAQRLGLAGRRLRVVAIASTSPADELDAPGLRLWDLAAFQLAAAFRPIATTLMGGVTYALLPSSRNEVVDLTRLTETLTMVLARATSTLGAGVMAGIGRVGDANEVPRSRYEADQVLRVGRMWGLRNAISTFDDVRMEVLLLQLSEMAGSDSSLLSGPIQAVVQHDREHGTHYLRTLRAYFDTFGDVAAAARQLGVHMNTFRYRLRKLQELADLHLGDPNQRLLLMLQLRLLELGNGENSSPPAAAPR